MSSIAARNASLRPTLASQRGCLGRASLCPGSCSIPPWAGASPAYLPNCLPNCPAATTRERADVPGVGFLRERFHRICRATLALVQPPSWRRQDRPWPFPSPPLPVRSRNSPPEAECPHCEGADGHDQGHRRRKRSERAISLRNTCREYELTLRTNCPQSLSRQSLGATLPSREQFLPCGVDPHRCAPYQDRPCFAHRSGFRESGQRLALAIGRTILGTRTRTRNGDRTQRPDLVACVSWHVSLHRRAFASCVPALLADVPWQPQPPHRV
jgi:hypothetical protein